MDEAVGMLCCPNRVYTYIHISKCKTQCEMMQKLDLREEEVQEKEEKEEKGGGRRYVQGCNTVCKLSILQHACGFPNIPHCGGAGRRKKKQNKQTI